MEGGDQRVFRLVGQHHLKRLEVVSWKTNLGLGIMGSMGVFLEFLVKICDGRPPWMAIGGQRGAMVVEIWKYQILLKASRTKGKEFETFFVCFWDFGKKKILKGRVCVIPVI